MLKRTAPIVTFEIQIVFNKWPTGASLDLRLEVKSECSQANVGRFNISQKRPVQLGNCFVGGIR